MNLVPIEMLQNDQGKSLLKTSFSLKISGKRVWESHAEMGINSGQKSLKKVSTIQGETGINLGQKSLPDSVKPMPSNAMRSCSTARFKKLPAFGE